MRPFNEQAEQAFLGALLLNNAVAEKAESLLPEHFHIPVHGRIYEAVCALIRKGETADPVTLRAAFQGDLKDVGGAAYLMSLVTSACQPRVAGDYADQIVDLARRRSIMDAAEDAMERAGKDFEASAMDQVESLEAALFGIAERSVGGAQSIGFAIDDMLDFAMKQQSGEIVPVDTGFRQLDDILDGLMPGDLTLCGGRPGMGKTGVGMAIALHNAQSARPVGFIQLEMPGRQMSARAISGLVGVPVKPILRGQVGNWDAIVKAAKFLKELPLIIDDRPGVHIDQIISRARRMKRQHHIELLVVDYLGLIRAGDVNEYERITRVSQTMKELARALDVHVLALHQLSRANEARENKRPGLADLRGSGALEQDADNVIFVYREEYYLRKQEPDPGTDEHAAWSFAMSEARGKAELIVDKQRNGSTGTALTFFEAATTTFRDAA